MSETGMRFIQPPTPDDRIVAARIVGTATPEEMRTFITRVQAIHDRGEKALVYQFPVSETRDHERAAQWAFRVGNAETSDDDRRAGWGAECA